MITESMGGREDEDSREGEEKQESGVLWWHPSSEPGGITLGAALPSSLEGTAKTAFTMKGNERTPK